MPIDITWLHNNKTITHTNGISLLKRKKVSTLDIESVAQEHAGEYTCVAKNSAGSSFYSAVLNVNGTFLFFSLCH